MTKDIKRPDEILPNPDPSIITTEQIDRAVNNLEDKVNIRFDGIEKASEAFHADLTRVPTLLDRSILGLRELIEQRLDDTDERHVGLRDFVLAKVEELGAVTNEKFIGVDAQFSERDTRTDQRAGDTKLAVDAAFAAAKEATAKIEAGFTKQIDSMTLVIDTKTENLNGRIADLKDQMTALASRTAVSDPATMTALNNLANDMRNLQQYRDTTKGKSEGANWLWGAILGGAGFLFGLVGFIGWMMSHVKI